MSSPSARQTDRLTLALTGGAKGDGNLYPTIWGEKTAQGVSDIIENTCALDRHYSLVDQLAAMAPYPEEPGAEEGLYACLTLNALRALARQVQSARY